MTNILDHLVEITSLLVFVVGLIATWTKMTVKLNVLEKDILDNRAQMTAEMKRLEDAFNGGMLRCKAEHLPCQTATLAHHENMTLHQSPTERQLISEWRHDVTDRLSSIETLLREIKRNGK